jgi:hypothetical protein
LLARVQRRFVDGGHGIQGRHLAPVQHPRSLLATGIIPPAQTRTNMRAHAQIATPAAGYRTRTGDGHLHAGALSRALPTRTGSAEGVKRMIWKLGRCYLRNKGTDDVEVRALLRRRIQSCFPSKRLPPRPRPPRASTDRPLAAPVHSHTSASDRAGVAIQEREPTRAAASANMSARSEYASTGTTEAGRPAGTGAS